MGFHMDRTRSFSYFALYVTDSKTGVPIRWGCVRAVRLRV